MVVELTAIGTLAYLINYLSKYKERNLKNNFEEIMIKTGIKNRKDETFNIKDIEETSYGYIAYLNNVPGLSVEHLNSKINIIEDNLNAIVNIEKDRFKNYIKMQVVNKDLSRFKFEPVKCELNKLYIGKDFKGENYFIDLNKDSHILIGGATGTGKSFLLASILTNLIYNNSDKMDMYLLQICKSEISAFEECTCVKESCYNIERCTDSIINIVRELEYRSELFKKYGIRNITQWNKHNKNNYMKRIIVVLEEISFFLGDDLMEYVIKLAKAGRSVGIHLISCVQRSTATNIPPDLKSQMTRITFKQKSSIDSNNIINTPDAVKLKQQECIIDGNSDYSIIKTPWIDEDYVLLHKYVNEIKIPGPEEKEEIKTFKKDFKKIGNKIRTTEEVEIVDVEEIKELGSHTFKCIGAPKEKSKKRKGVISMEEFKSANKKR